MRIYPFDQIWVEWADKETGQIVREYIRTDQFPDLQDMADQGFIEMLNTK
jgi:hypothetical protein